MNIREEKANFGQTFSSAIVLRARALESQRNVQKLFEEAKAVGRKPSFEELSGASETMNKALLNLNKAQRLLHLLSGQYPEKKEQIGSILDKLSLDMEEAVPYSSYVSQLHYDKMPVTVSNPFAKSTKPMVAVRPSREMRIHEAPVISGLPESRIEMKDQNSIDDGHGYDPNEEYNDSLNGYGPWEAEDQNVLRRFDKEYLEEEPIEVTDELEEPLDLLDEEGLESYDDHRNYHPEHNPEDDIEVEFRHASENLSQLTKEADYDDEDDLEASRDNTEQMLSGLSSILGDLGGPALAFLQKQLAKLIEQV